MLKALFYPDLPFDRLSIPHMYREVYLDLVYADIPKDYKVILDIGANIGITAQYFKDRAKKVYSIEPSSQHFEALKKNKEYNQWSNVEIFNIAIADRDGYMQLNKYDDNYTTYSLTTKFKKDSEIVKTMAIDTFLKENKIEEVDFMKLDVEGAEDLILRSDGFKKVVNKIKRIEIEFHLLSWKNLIDYLKSLGFQFTNKPAQANIGLFTR